MLPLSLECQFLVAPSILDHIARCNIGANKLTLYQKDHILGHFELYYRVDIGLRGPTTLSYYVEYKSRGHLKEHEKRYVVECLFIDIYSFALYTNCS